LFEVKAKAIRFIPIQIKDYGILILIGALALIAGISVFLGYQLGYFKKNSSRAGLYLKK